MLGKTLEIRIGGNENGGSDGARCGDGPSIPRPDEFCKVWTDLEIRLEDELAGEKDEIPESRRPVLPVMTSEVPHDFLHDTIGDHAVESSRRQEI